MKSLSFTVVPVYDTKENIFVWGKKKFVWTLYSDKGLKPTNVNDELANFLDRNVC